MRTNLEVLAHAFCQYTQADTCEVIDGESGVFRNIHREHASTCMLDLRVSEPLREHFQPHTLHHFLHHDLDKDTTATRCVVFVDLDAFQRHPGNCIASHEMAEEARDVAQAVRLVSVDCGIVVVKCLLERIRPYAIQLAEALANKPVES